MKVKALIDCVGVGYDMKQGEIYDIDLKLVKKLVAFNYVEEIKQVKTKATKASE